MVQSLRSLGLSGEDPSFPNGLRAVGDKHTWRIALDVTWVRRRLLLGSTQLPIDPVVTTSWKFQRFTGRDGPPFLFYVTLKTRFLRHEYVSGDETAISTALSTVESVENNGGDE